MPRRTTTRTGAVDVRRRIDEVSGWVARGGSGVLGRADDAAGTGKLGDGDEPPVFAESMTLVPMRNS